MNLTKPRRGRTLALILFVAAVHFTFGSEARGQDGLILTSVQFVGSTRYSDGEILKATGLKIGGNVTQEMLQQAADKLAYSGAFAEVNYRYQSQGPAAKAEFDLRDASTVLTCKFGNLIWFSEEEIQKALRENVPLYNGSVPMGGHMTEEIIAVLEGMLRQKGLDARVVLDTEVSLGSSIEDAQFNEVSVPIPVRGVGFTGVEKLDPALLEKAASPLIGENYNLGYISEFMDSTASLPYYQNGYLEVHFGAPAAKILIGSAPANSVLVTIPVAEGEKYTLGHLTWSGETSIPYPDLAKLIKIKPGGSFDRVEFEQDVYAMALLFHPKGYRSADVNYELTLDHARLTANCAIQVRQGRLYHVGSVAIAGIDDSQQQTVLQALPLHKGDPYNSDLLNGFYNVLGKYLPSNDSGWKASLQESVHEDSATVDVRILVAPRASH